MSLLLEFTAGAVVTTLPAIPSTSDTVLALRWSTFTDGASGALLQSNGIPVKQGQATPANLATAKVVITGTGEVAGYLEGLGAYPDGSFRSILLQTLPTFVANVPQTGEIRFNETFTVPRRTKVASTWTNTEVAFPGGGGPAALALPLSTSHLCAALSSFLPLTPQASQPVFPGSVGADAAFDSTQPVVMNAKATWPVFGADYDAVIGCLHKWARTGDVTWFKLFASDWWNTRAWLNTAGNVEAPWGENGASWQPSEPRQYYETALNAYLLLGDEGARTAIFNTAALSDNYAYLSPNYNATGNWALAGSLGEFVGNTRFHSKAIAALAFFNMAYSPDTVTNGVTHRVWGERWLERMLSAPFWNGSYWRNYVSDPGPGQTYGQIDIGAYQQGLMCRNIVALCSTMPSGAARTAGLNAVSANLLWMRTNLVQTSLDGVTPQLIYFTQPPGFASLPDENESRNSVDLNGFFAAMFAWRAWRENSVADANLARSLYATIDNTPRDNQTGPQIGNGSGGQQKQQQEAFFMSQAIHYYLKLSGL